jgi:hypothetical protein
LQRQCRQRRPAIRGYHVRGLGHDNDRVHEYENWDDDFRRVLRFRVNVIELDDRGLRFDGRRWRRRQHGRRQRRQHRWW